MERAATQAEYDYIVVGSSLAAPVLAARLAQQADVRVLLVEAADTLDRQLDESVFAAPPPSVLRQWALTAGPEWARPAIDDALEISERSLPFHDRPRHELATTFLHAAQEIGAPIIGASGTDLPEGAAWNRELRSTDLLAPLSAGAHSGWSGRLTRHSGYVTELVIESGRCVGVRLTASGDLRTVRAAREVIVSAGAIQSPLLLQRSGIGAGSELRAHGTDVVVDLPGVGRNLHDAPVVLLPFTVEPHPTARPLRGAPASLLWRSDAGLDSSDMQLTVLGPRVAEHAFVLALTLAPLSRGEVRLAPPGWGEIHILKRRLLTDDADVDRMLDALGVVRDLAETAAFASVGCRELAPTPFARSLTGLREYVRRIAGRAGRAGGTCAMGITPSSVVDSHLRVHGVSALRVIDESVLPAPTAVNPNAATIAIAVRGAELLLAGTPAERSHAA